MNKYEIETVLKSNKPLKSKMATRGIRRKKSSLSEVKVAVFGASGVGKSGTILLFIHFNIFESIIA